MNSPQSVSANPSVWVAKGVAGPHINASSPSSDTVEFLTNRDLLALVALTDMAPNRRANPTDSESALEFRVDFDRLSLRLTPEGQRPAHAVTMRGHLQALATHKRISIAQQGRGKPTRISVCPAASRDRVEIPLGLLWSGPLADGRRLRSVDHRLGLLALILIAQSVNYRSGEGLVRRTTLAKRWLGERWEDGVRYTPLERSVAALHRATGPVNPDDPSSTPDSIIWTRKNIGSGHLGPQLARLAWDSLPPYRQIAEEFTTQESNAVEEPLVSENTVNNPWASPPPLPNPSPMSERKVS